MDMEDKAMSKRVYGKEFGFHTRAVHTGNDVDGETGALRRPIVMANSYALPYDPSELNWSEAGKNLYTRNGGSNQ
jgi:methionine-gamma-lyase